MPRCLQFSPGRVDRYCALTTSVFTLGWPHTAPGFEQRILRHMIRAALAWGKNADSDTDESVISTSSALHLHHGHDVFGRMLVCIQNAPGQLLHKTLLCLKLLLCMWVFHLTYVFNLVQPVWLRAASIAPVNRAALHTCHLGHLTQLQSQTPCALCVSVPHLISSVYGASRA